MIKYQQHKNNSVLGFSMENDVLPTLGNKTPVKPADNWIECKNIYTDRLRDVLVPIVYDTMYSIHNDAIQLANNNGNYAAVVKTFMDFLAETKVWSINIINGETQEILRICPWLAQLLKGVFVSHVMVLSSAQLNRPNAPVGKVRLNIPTCPVFVQNLYTHVATHFFNHPNLFQTTGLTSDQMIANKERAYQEIRSAIDETVRALIPFPQVIESSMNFRGNNPVITAKMSQSTHYSTPRQKSQPVQTIPPVPQKSNKPVADDTIKTGAATVNNTGASEFVQSQPVHKTVAVAAATRISFAQKSSPVPPKNPSPVRRRSKQRSQVARSANTPEKSPQRQSNRPKTSPRRRSQEKERSKRYDDYRTKKVSSPPRASQFRLRTGSDAINNVLQQLKLDTSNSSSTSSSSSSSSTSSSSYGNESVSYE